MQTVIHRDALEYMKALPDKIIDLIVTDPPYGLNIVKNGKVGGAGKNFIGKLVNARDYGRHDWDKAIPSQEVFDEMRRVSKNQIIFGGNYFCNHLPQGTKWLVWDKKATGRFSVCELIWTSFKGRIEKFEWEWNGFIQGNGKGGRQRVKRIHPSQKPVELLEWIIRRFSDEGDTILDPFLGSGTTCVAAKNVGGRICIGIEKDKQYAKSAYKRILSS